MSAPSPRARRLFAWLLLGIIAAYGIGAIALSVHIIHRQAAVRTELTMALENLDRLHQLVAVSAPGERAAVDAAWADRRALLLPSAKVAAKLEDSLLQEWRDAFPHAACGMPGSPFQTQLPRAHAARACHILVERQGAEIRVQAYDTQGLPMDNFYEFLYPYPPASRSELEPSVPLYPLLRGLLERHGP